jgi:hypothetical protein
MQIGVTMIRKGLVVFALLAAAAMSCVQAPTERTARVQQRAETTGVRVSAPTKLLAGRRDRAVGSGRRLVCGSQGCAVFYLQEGRLLASRVAADGTLQDDPRIAISGLTSSTATLDSVNVVALGSEWLVAVRGGTDGQLLRLDGATLAVTAELDESLGDAAGELYTDGVTLLMVSALADRFDPRTLSLVNTASWTLMQEHSVSFDTTIVPGAGQYLIVEEGYAGDSPTVRRLQGASGDFLETPTPLFPTGFLGELDSVATIRGVYDGAGHYQLALGLWRSSGAAADVIGSRVAHSTVPLTGGAIPGGSTPAVLCAGCGDLSRTPPFGLPSSGEAWAFASADGLFAVDISSGERVSGDNQAVDAAPLEAQQLVPASDPFLALTAQGTATVEVISIDSISLGPAVPEAWVGHDLALAPRVVPYGDRFLVAWRSEQDQLLRAVLVAADADGAPQPVADPVSIGNGQLSSFAVAGIAGHGFLVVQTVHDRGNDIATWHGYMLDEQLQVQSEWQEKFALEPLSYAALSVTAGGAGYLLSAYMGPLTSGSGAGSLLMQRRAPSGEAQGEIQILSDSAEYGLAHACVDAAATPAEQQFAVFGRLFEGTATSTWVWRVAASDGSVSDVQELAAVAPHCVGIAGQGLLLHGGGQLLLNFGSGSVTNVSLAGDASGPLSTVQWDGIALVGLRETADELTAHRYSFEGSTITSLDPAHGIKVAALNTRGRSSFAASQQAQGRSLVAYESVATPDFVRELNVVLFEHDGEPTLGEGGAGGVGGEAGNAGNGAEPTIAGGAPAAAGAATEPEPIAGGAAGGAFGAEAGQGGAELPPPRRPRTSSGCGCSLPSDAAGSNPALSLLLIAGSSVLVSARRRRRSQSRRPPSRAAAAEWQPVQFS